MPGAWYNLPEASQILDAVSPAQMSIVLTKDGTFQWTLRDDLEKRLELLRFKMVDQLLGYNVDDPGLDFDSQDRWYEFEERQASIHDRLLLKWGDPNVLLGYGIDTANLMWRKDPNAINRTIAKQRDIAIVQRDLERAGRL